MNHRAVYSAPGKLVLLGEYAVLEGARAMVAAVTRRATGTTNPAAPPPTPVVAAALAIAEGHRYPRLGDGVTIDTRDFSRDGKKLGLGSSAVASLLATALATGRDDEVTLELAIEAHRRASNGEGSGVDVAASFHGGVIAAARQPALVTPLASRCPGLFLTVIATGESAATTDMVAACRAASTWSSWVKVLGQIAAEGIRAWSMKDTAGFLSAIARAGRAMEKLGVDAGRPVVTPAIAAIMEEAGRQNAAAKPSGAGGGDVAIVFATDEDIGRRVAESVGLAVIDLAIDPIGLRRES